jgi:hypothetical protein
MWLLYLALAIIIIGVILFIIDKRKPILSPEPAPEQKYLVVKIENSTENFQKVYTLEDNQVVVVFKNDKHIETINNNEFAIYEFAKIHQINVKDLDIYSYHFYVFNQSPIYNLSINMEKSIRIMDAEYGIPIGILPKGKISIQITDIPLLFKTLNLFRNSYSYTGFFKDLGVYFQRVVTRGIIQFCYENKVSFIVLNYYVNELEKHVRTMMDLEISEYGMYTTMVEFTEFLLEASDELKQLDSMMLKKQKFDLLKYTYIDEKKKQLMDKIDFRKKAKVNKQELNEDINDII